MTRNWPAEPGANASSHDKKIAQAEGELAKAARQDELDLDEETAKKLYTELLALATQSVERARKSAELVQAAAVAIAGLYTGILGFIFVAKDSPMPWRGIWPTIFLAGAVVLAMSYVAFLTRTPGVAQPRPPAHDDPQQRLLRRAYFFTQVTRTLIHQRARLLRAAVISLAVGVLFLPAVFLEFDALGSLVASETGKPMPSGSVATPTAVPTPVVWPTPAFEEPRALAMIVYNAQVDVFKAQLTETERTPDDDFWESIAVLVFAAAGGFVVVQAARNDWPVRVA